MKRALFLLFAFLAFYPLDASAQSVGGACTAAQEGYQACVAAGCFKCTSLVWVAQPLAIGNSSATCSSTLAGVMRWTGSAMQYCSGSAWTDLGGSSSATQGTLCGLSYVTYTYNSDGGDSSWGTYSHQKQCSSQNVITGSSYSAPTANCPSGYSILNWFSMSYYATSGSYGGKYYYTCGKS